MRIGFLIKRANMVPWCEGAIRAAHQRGHEPVLILDQRGPAIGPKADRFPATNRVPLRLAQTTAIERYGDAKPCDALVVPGPIGWDFPHLPVARFYAALQTSVTDALNFVRSNWDVYYGWSKWWNEPVLAASSRSAGRLLGVSFVPVGHPLAEHLSWIDPEEVRTTFNLPAGQTVVLYLPFPFGAHEQSWRLRYGYRYSPWGDRAVVRAVREYATRHNALLFVCARPKVEVPKYLRRAADRFFLGDEPGEPTVLRLLTVSSLLVHHLSSAVAESVAAGVRALAVVPDGWTAYEGRGPEFDPGSDRSLYRWHFCAFLLAPQWTASHLLNVASTPTGSSWYLDSTRGHQDRAAYVSRFLGGEPFRAGERIVQDLEFRLGV